MSNWKPIENEADLPKRKGDGSYEQQDCLVVYKGQVNHLVWNCEHEVWDDMHGDDYFCDSLEPTYWMPLPTPPVETKEK